jgi:heme/copper-type cytochrome/quinol oxidase subunit 3
MGRHVTPVWFFVGSLLAIYGVLILGSGLADWSNPSNTALAELHAPVWWGAILLVSGVIYTLVYRPRK